MRSISISAAALLLSCGGGGEASSPCEGIDCAPGQCVADGASARCACPDGYTPQGLSCTPDGGDSDADTDTDPGCGDYDGDGYPDLGCGGTDCNDLDDTIHPFATEQGVWTIETVDPDSIGEVGAVSLAVAGTDVFLCYGDAGALHYAAREGGAWTIDDGLGAVSFDSNCSIAASADDVYIAYQGDTGGATVDLRLVQGTRPDGPWSDNRIDGSSAPPMPAIDLDTDGQAHLVYRNECNLVYRRERDGWFAAADYTNADACGPFMPSLDVENWGNTRLAWIGSDGHAKFAHNQGGWEVTDLGEGWAPTGVLNHGDASVVYVEPGGASVHYDYQVGETWQGPWTIPGWEPSIAKDSDGQPHLIVRGESSEPMYVSPPSPSSSELFIMRIEDAGCQSPDIAVGSDGLHAAWRDRNRGIRHAVRFYPDGVDQNCDGIDGVDGDGDGHASRESWGDDCNDSEKTVIDCG